MMKNKRIKKTMISFLAGITLMGVGIGTSIVFNQPTVAHAEPASGGAAMPSPYVKVKVGNKMRTIKIQGTKGSGPFTNIDGWGIAPAISGYVPSTWGAIHFHYNEKTKTTKLITKLFYTKIKYTNLKATKVHFSKGEIYSTSCLNKLTHYGKNYSHMTFVRTKQAKIRRVDGKYENWQYVKSITGNIKGWIFSGYVKTGNAPKGTTVLKYTNIKDAKVHVTKGTMYSSARLSKVAHYGKNYKHTTFKETEQASVVKSNGKTYIYTHIQAGKVSGWIWHGYIKNGSVK